MHLPLPTLALLALGLAPAAAPAETFVLVHGAFQTARSWDAVAAELRQGGHDVVAVDLPGRDASGAAARAVTLAAYVEAVRDAVEAAGEPVVLVGHSFGGMTISAVAEAVPERIGQLVYVAAYVPQSGESMQALAEGDHDNDFTAETFVIAPDHAHAEILAADRVRVFAQDADAARQAALLAGMVREPLAPIGTPVTLSAERFGTVAKAYIRTLDDGAVSTPLQTMMIDRAGIAEVRDLEGGHAPYLTRPTELAAVLVELGAP